MVRSPSGYAISLGAIAAALLVLFGPVLARLVGVWWRDPNYGHGFWVPCVAAVVLWQRRQALQLIPRRGTPWGLVACVAGLLLLFLASRMEGVGFGNAATFAEGVALLATTAGLVWLLLGTGHLRAVAPVLAYLLLMVPWPNLVYASVTAPLQQFAAQAATVGLRVLGIPVLRQGNVLVLPFLELGVEEACSGIRSVFALLSVAGAMVLLFVRQWGLWRKVLLVVSSIPIAVVANALRVTVTGLVAHQWGLARAEGVYHESAGAAVFLLGALLLCGGFVLLGGRQSAIHPAADRAPDAAAAPPDTRRAEVLARAAAAVFVAAALLWSLALPAAPQLRGRESAQQPSVRLDGLPDQIGPWRRIADGALPLSVARQTGADAWLLRTYAAQQGPPLVLYIGYAADGDYGSDRPQHPPWVCYPAQGWAITSRASCAMHGPGGANPSAELYTVERGAERQLVLFWLQRSEGATSWSPLSFYRSGLLSRIRQLHSPREPARAPGQMFVRISAEAQSDDGASRASLVSFAEELLPGLSSLLASTRPGAS